MVKALIPNRETTEEVLLIETHNEWSVQDLSALLEGVNTVYNVYSIIDLVNNSKIHAKVVDLVVQRVTEYENIVDSSPIDEIFDDGSLRYPKIPTGKNFSTKNVIMHEVFRILEQYIKDSEKLKIHKVSMGASEGIKVWSPKKRNIFKDKNQPPSVSPAKASNSDLEQEHLSALAKTSNFLNTLRDKDTNELTINLLLENRISDPRLMKILEDNLINGPVEDMKKLMKSGQVGKVKMMNSEESQN